MWNLKFKLLTFFFAYSLTAGFLLAYKSDEEKNHLLDFITREVNSRKSGGDFIYMFRNRHELLILIEADNDNLNKLPSRAQEAQTLFQRISGNRKLNENILEESSIEELVKSFIEKKGKLKVRPFSACLDLESRLSAIEVDGVREDGSGTRFWIIAELTDGNLWRIVDSKWVLVWD